MNEKYKDTDLREALRRKYADTPKLPADFMKDTHPQPLPKGGEDKSPSMDGRCRLPARHRRCRLDDATQRKACKTRADHRSADEAQACSCKRHSHV